MPLSFGDYCRLFLWSCIMTAIVLMYAVTYFDDLPDPAVPFVSVGSMVLMIIFIQERIMRARDEWEQRDLSMIRARRMAEELWNETRRRGEDDDDE